MRRIAARCLGIACSSSSRAFAALPGLWDATTTARCSTLLIPNQKVPRRIAATAPPIAESIDSVGLGGVPSGDDGETLGPLLCPTCVSDRKQRGHRPAGSPGEIGAPHCEQVAPSGST